MELWEYKGSSPGIFTRDSFWDSKSICSEKERFESEVQSKDQTDQGLCRWIDWQEQPR